MCVYACVKKKWIAHPSLKPPQNLPPTTPSLIPPFYIKNHTQKNHDRTPQTPLFNSKTHTHTHTHTHTNKQPGADDDETLARVRAGKFAFPPSVFDQISTQGKDFITKLLVRWAVVGQSVNQCDQCGRSVGVRLPPSLDGIPHTKPTTTNPPPTQSNQPTNARGGPERAHDKPILNPPTPNPRTNPPPASRDVSS